MSKRYFWLKLQRDFFKRHDIRIVESMSNGKDYILFYLKLLVESIDHEGELRFSETIPYNEDMLATITNTNIDIVRSAMKLFIELGMINILEDSTIFMTEVNKMIGSEGESAKRMRNHRQNLIGPSQCDTNVQKSDTEKEKEIDKEQEKEKEQELDLMINQIKLNDEDYTCLDSHFKDVDRLIKYAIRKIMDRECDYPISDLYSYIIKLANNEGWPTK